MCSTPESTISWTLRRYPDVGGGASGFRCPSAGGGIHGDLEIAIAFEDRIEGDFVLMAPGHQLDADGRRIGGQRPQRGKQQDKYFHIRFRSSRVPTAAARLRMGQFGRQ